MGVQIPPDSGEFVGKTLDAVDRGHILLSRGGGMKL
jgi:hypothetical protein